MTKVNQVLGFTYASPRYHTTKFASSPFASDDYQEYDALNGTYDKFWPLYAVTESEEPKSFLVNSAGIEKEIKGDLSLFLYKDNYAPRSIGAVGYLNPTVNTNLDKVDYSFSLWLQPELNPGWTNIQSYGSASGTFGGFLIRLLSNSELIKENHSIKLEKAPGDTSTVASASNFPKGTIVEYEGKVYKCLTPTNLYPDNTSASWQSLNEVGTTFYADMYVFNSEGTTVYHTSFEDRERTFDPKRQGTDLVAWNISAWYE